jgi:tRNA A-37 threonylcarbamoyl transferase component Bud32/DNA-binding beta-propeller fold protein YncE
MSLLELGSVFAGHGVEALVGRGGMGVVYRARHLELERVVALKVIAPELLDDPLIRERFLREARTAASIEHPNVIPLHYVGEEDGIAYLAMRFIDGDDVRTLVQTRGVMPPGRAADVTTQTAAALDAIHEAGFVHRDVKPANLLVARGGHVYLTDFGLAKQIVSREGATRSGHWVGTLDYVAPEQIRGGRVDARADVYALGGVLHFMLTSHVPYDRESDEAKLWGHLTDPPPLPSRLRPELPVALDAVVERAMAKVPADRYPSAGDLGRAARAAAGDGAPVEPERTVARGAASPEGAARQPGLAEEVPTLTGVRRGRDAAPTAVLDAARPRRSRRRPLAIVAVAMLAAGIAALVAIPGSDEEPPPRRPPITVGQTIEDVGTRPNGIAVAAGSLWVTSYGRSRVVRIDAETGRVRAEAPRVGRGALDIAAGRSAVWVAVTPQSVVVRLDPETGRVAGHIRTPLRPVDLAAGAEDLWVVGRAAVKGGADALLHYDGDGQLLRRVEVPQGVAAITLGGGALWVAELRIGRVLRVDPRTGRSRARAPLESPGYELTYGKGYVWVTQRDDDSIARIDPDTSAAVASAAGHGPTGIAVAGDHVLVASTTDHTVVVIDPRTAKPVGRPLQVGLNPYAVATSGGHAWVTNVAGNSVTRLDIGGSELVARD